MAMVAEMGNLLLSFMSAWMVGNVEAPANANIIEPKAGKKEIITKVCFNFKIFH